MAPTGHKRKQPHSFTPQVAQSWSDTPFATFKREFRKPGIRGLSVDYKAWQEFFKDAFEVSSLDWDTLEATEAEICASASPFGQRLQELRSQHSDWPFVAGNLNLAAWLRVLSEDEAPPAADVYFSLSRGLAVLPPELAQSFPATQTANYQSALEHAEVVDAEVDRLQRLGFLQDWDQALAELGLDPDTPPNVLAIGAVLRKGKVRIVVNASAPRGRSVNDAMEPPPTVLPSIVTAMAAMTHHGWAWKADFTDAFLHTCLHPSSVPLCVIEWKGQLLAYRRLGFGFRSGPSHQQSMTLCVVRALTRRLRRAGVTTATAPSLDHLYPRISAASPNRDRVNALVAFLDDVGCFTSSRATAWYSFAAYLLLCRELSLGVALKQGKTDGPRQLLHYLGFDCDMVNDVISLHTERLEALRAKMEAISLAESVSVREVLSLIGVLVFCSVVIPLGKTHYHALQDAVVALGPRRSMSSLVQVSAAMRDSISMWAKLLSLLNARSARAPILRATVPGEVTTDASLSGWGWAGMGICAAGAWPTDWEGRLGRAIASNPAVDSTLRRIFICECEAWAVLFMARALVPRCKHCRLVVRVDNEPVVHMLQKLSCRSRACLPIIREIAWLCATWDVELECVWIATADNKLSDALSRRYTPQYDAKELLGLLREFKRDPVQWDVSWPPQRAARPELLKHIQVAQPSDFSSAWASLHPDDLRYIFPRMLRRVSDGPGGG